MHYAIALNDVEISEKILATMTLSGEKYAIYVAWEVPSEDNRNPNGHSVQLIYS